MFKPALRMWAGTFCAILGATALAAPPETASRSFTAPLQKTAVGFTPIRTLEQESDASAQKLPAAVPAEKGAVSTPLSAPAREATSHPAIFGCVLSSKASATSAAHAIGMWSFTNDVFSQKNKGTKATQAQGSGAPVGSYYYAFRRTGTGLMYIDKFAMSNWSRSSATQVTNVGLRASDVAYDPTSDIVYGCFYNNTGDAYVFGKIDYATRVRTAIKPLDMMWNAVMATADGQIYAIDMTGDLLKVNKTTGDWTVVGNTGVVPAYQTSATIDLATGICYWNAIPSSGVSSLYTVDLSTGAATKLYDFANNDEITGMFIPAPKTSGDAPAAPADLSASFSDNSLSGSISVTAPSSTYGGATGEGSLTCKTWVNGELKYESACQWSDVIEIPLTVENGDKYYIVASFSNEQGEGPKKRIAKFIGNDTPKAPAPVLTRQDDDFIVKWNKVTASVNGGYINPDDLRYTVVRYPDKVTVAENISETEFRDFVPEVYGQMTPYKYSVAASWEGNMGAYGTSPLYPLGTIVPPYSEGFDDAESLNNFIVEDTNGDGVKWQYSGGLSSAYITNSSQTHNDWLITAAIYLTAGTTYTLTYEAMASMGAEKLEVCMGREAVSSAMTTTLVAPMDLEADCTLKSNPVEFTVPESGTYHIGFHAISEPGMFFLYVDNIYLSCPGGREAEAVDAPWIETFDKSSVLSAFTIIDGNHDGRIWNVDKGEARIGYGEGEPVDDWLISPPVRLQSGASYNIRLKARTRTQTKEKFEVRLGTENTPDALTTEVIPVTEVTSPEYAVYSELVKVPADGTYYIGIHGCSDPYQYELYIDDFEVCTPVFDAAPGQPTEGQAEGAEYGQLRAKVSFKAPVTTVDGSALESITKIDVLYNDQTIHTFDNPTPGQLLECEGDVETIGDHTWIVVPSNEYGAGLPLEITGYVGVGMPNPPTDVTISEEGNTGKVTLTWTAPTQDVLGHGLNPEGVTYLITELIGDQQLIIVRNVPSTSYTLQAAGADTQTFKTYGVYAVTDAGIGRGTPSPTIPVGKPHETPWTESAAGGVTGPMITQSLIPGAGWGLAPDGYLGMNSYDGDNGFFFMESSTSGAAAGIVTGKIDLTGLETPALSFYTYNIFTENIPDLNSFVVEVRPADSDEFDRISSFVISECAPAEGWTLMRADLSAYAGQTVSLRIAAVADNCVYTFVDAISVDNAPLVDLELTTLSAPESVVTGAEAPLTFKVRNIGIQPADSHSFGVIMDGENVRQHDGEQIRSMEMKEITLSHRFTPFDPTGDHTLWIEAAHDDDTVAENNLTSSVTLRHEESGLPTVRNLEGKLNDFNQVTLTWALPEIPSGATLSGYRIYKNGNASACFETEANTYTDQDTDVSGSASTYGVSAVYTTGESNVVSTTVTPSGADSAIAAGFTVQSIGDAIVITGAASKECAITSDSGLTIWQGICSQRTAVKAAPGIYVVKLANRSVTIVH